MELHWQPQFPGLLEDPLHLRERKCQVFAERIHRIHQPFLMQFRQQSFANIVNPGIRPLLILDGHRMGRQAGTAHGQRQYVA